MIIRTNRELKQQYHVLQKGDCFLGMLSFKNLRHQMFIDLLERGVCIIPSSLSQMLARSKAAQAMFLNPWMIPHTTVVNRRIGLLHLTNRYVELGVGAVVTKEDRLHCGMGIHRWDHIEAVYNHASHRPESFPFVVQPFIKDYTDIRVVVAGDYWEAYQRENKNNFRNNLSVGGKRRPYELNETQVALCKAVLKRGKFPYAHIDLLVKSDGTSYLSEIALNGGLKGARIERGALDEMKKDILEKAAAKEHEKMEGDA